MGAERWALMVFVASLGVGVGCHKESSHRVRHAKQHNNASPTAVDDEAPPAPPAPTANVVMPAATPLPAPPPSPPARELTVESSVPVPMPPRRGSRRVVAAAPPPAPAPEPARPSAPSGSRCEGGSGKGERLAVQGVAADDVLNVREAPDKGAAVLGGLPPDATGVRGTSNRRRVGASTWREVECGNLRGWVNERFLARDTGTQ